MSPLQGKKTEVRRVDLSEPTDAQEGEIFVSIHESISLNPHYELLSNRTRKRLDGNGIYSLADLIEWDGSSLLEIRGFGIGCLDEVNTFLHFNGVLPAPREDNDSTPSARALRGYAALSEKASTVLGDASIYEGQDLQEITVQDLLAIPGMNDSVVDEIVAAGFMPQARDQQDLLLKRCGVASVT